VAEIQEPKAEDSPTGLVARHAPDLIAITVTADQEISEDGRKAGHYQVVIIFRSTPYRRALDSMTLVGVRGWAVWSDSLLADG
jgi:hypothetical protein